MAKKEAVKTYKSPVSGAEYSVAEYEALTVAELKEEGFIHDPKVVYETIEDKVANFSGEKEYTLEAQANGEKIPVGTKIHGMEESHFNFNGVKVASSDSSATE